MYNLKTGSVHFKPTARVQSVLYTQGYDLQTSPLLCVHILYAALSTRCGHKNTGGMGMVNPFTATLLFRAWHGLGNLVLLINNTVKYLETIYEYVPHALRDPEAYHN